MKKSFTKIIAGVTLAGSLFAIPAFAAGGNGAGTGNGNAARQEQGIRLNLRDGSGENFIDEDNDGVCDLSGSGMRQRGANRSEGKGSRQGSGSGMMNQDGTGSAYVDADGDGVCDNR